MEQAGGGGNSRLWGAIKEVGVEEIPPKYIPTRQSKWQALHDELMLRLQQTQSKFALAVPFEDEKTARTAKGAIVSMTNKRHGSGYIRTAVRPNGKGWVLYVHRGPAYK